MTVTCVQPGGRFLIPTNRLATGKEAVAAVRVEALDASRFAEWNRLVAGAGSGSFFHGSGWMEVLRDSYGFRAVGLVFRRGESVVGLVPLVEVLSAFTGRRGVSLPFADECPPLVPDGTPAANLLGPLVEFTRQQGWDYVEVRGVGDSLRPDVASVGFYGHRIELPSDPAVLWDRLKSPVRTGVRKAEAEGVGTEISTSIEALREFHHLYRLTRQRHGLPPQPFSFFAAIHDRVISRGAGRIVLARGAGRCLAGAVFLEHGGRALFKYGAFDARYQHLRANNLLFWTAFRHYIGKGFSFIDLGRTSLDNSGLRRFKQGWASEEYSLQYAKYDLRKDAFVKEADMTAGWYNWAFRLAPRWLSAIAGKVLYKHWA